MSYSDKECVITVLAEGYVTAMHFVTTDNHDFLIIDDTNTYSGVTGPML